MLASAEAQLAAPLAAHAASAAPAAISGGVPLYSWGANYSGQLGNGMTQSSPTRGQVGLPPGVTAVSVAGGAGFGLAAGSNGIPYAWGSNSDGQLGNPKSVLPGLMPIPVGLPSGVIPVAVAAGDASSYALGANGVAYAWGSNEFGQLGTGSTARRVSLPAAVRLPRQVHLIAIAAGEYSAYALSSNGALYSWGRNHVGELGDGSLRDSNTPTHVRLPFGVRPVQIAAGHASGYALGSNGTIYSWGDNYQGQLGNPGAGVEARRPVTVSFPPFATPTSISGGYSAGYAIGSNGFAYAWGDNSDGQLGNGSTRDSRTPVRVSLSAGVTPVAVTGGRLSAYAVDSAGELLAWGSNAFGQLGDGTFGHTSRPVVTSLPFGVSEVVLGAEPTSLSGYAIAGAAGPGDSDRKTAVLKVTVGGPGPDITVVGGGGGIDHSNCTTEETNTSVTAGPDPTTVAFGFVAKSSGSCATEPSYSYFQITVSGKTAAGKPVSASARIFFGQAGSAGISPYEAFCDTPLVNMTCSETSDRELALKVSS
jgi:alpha-tubulin suppressor-like RCC1 family protein